MSWDDAARIAQKASPTPVEKRSDGLPYLFQSSTSRGILVHRGRIVTERGPAVAGAYLRDLGIVDGKGPSVHDVVHLLTILDALPKIPGLVGDEFINVPGVPRLADLTARVEADGREARVVLHYFLDAIPGPPAVLSGAPSRRLERPIARATLTIPRDGDATWTVTEFGWLDPG